MFFAQYCIIFLYIFYISTVINSCIINKNEAVSDLVLFYLVSPKGSTFNYFLFLETTAAAAATRAGTTARATPVAGLASSSSVEGVVTTSP